MAKATARTAAKRQATPAPARAAPEPPPAADSREGALLAVTEAGIVGWAWDAANPNVPVQVVLLADDRPLATAIADRFDIGLVRDRAGPGLPGFAIRLAGLPPGRFPMQLALRDLTGIPLGPPITVHGAEELLRAIDHASDAYDGHIEGMRDGFLHGWVWNPAMPDVPVVVELFDGEERLARSVANQHRGDLQAAGKRGGACGFAFPLPAALLDGAPHTLRVRIAETRIEIGGGPLNFGQLTVMPLFEEVARLRLQIDRLARIVEQLTEPNSTFQRELVRALYERVHAYGEVQREMVERELDALRRIALDPGAIAPDTGAAGLRAADKRG